MDRYKCIKTWWNARRTGGWRKITPSQTHGPGSIDTIEIHFGEANTVHQSWGIWAMCHVRGGVVDGTLSPCLSIFPYPYPEHRPCGTRTNLPGVGLLLTPESPSENMLRGGVGCDRRRMGGEDSLNGANRCHVSWLEVRGVTRGDGQNHLRTGGTL